MTITTRLSQQLVLSIFLLLCFNSNALAQGITVPQHLEVTVESLHVRSSPPWFSWKTLITFKYAIAPPVAILKIGTKIRANQISLVGKNQQWLKIKYKDEGKDKTGWIYVGQKPSLVNVKIIAPPLGNRDTLNNTNTFYIDQNKATASPLLGILLSPFIPFAHASNGVIEEQNPPNFDAPTNQVVIVQIIYATVFLIALIIIYKSTKGDRFLTLFGASSILLIFGFLSQSSLITLASKFSGI